MRNLSVAMVVLGALAAATPVAAADIALKAPPPVAPYNWTGFYVGGNIGYSWGNANSNFNNAFGFLGLPDVPISTSQRLDGLIGGGQIGYNWQANNTWVFGLEADFQGSGEKGSSSISDPFRFEEVLPVLLTDPVVNGAVTLTNSVDIQWFGTVRGRVGALVNPTTLVYGTGGLAYGGISASGTLTNSIPSLLASRTASFGGSATEVGWTLGAGIEGAIPNTSNWTWKLEYLYIDFGAFSGNGVTPFGEPYSWSTRVTDNILRVGINYRFY